MVLSNLAAQQNQLLSILLLLLTEPFLTLYQELQKIYLFNYLKKVGPLKNQTSIPPPGPRDPFFEVEFLYFPKISDDLL
jgi:hypothetical protein